MKTNMVSKWMIGLLLGVMTSSSMADIVFDPRNFAKNAITSREVIKQTALEAQQLATQINQYKTMLQSMKALNPQVVSEMISRGLIPPGSYDSVGEVNAAANGVYASTQGIMDAMSGMNTVYNDYDRIMGELDRESIATGASIDQVLQYHYKQAKEGRAHSRNQYLELQRLTQNVKQYQMRQEGIRQVLTELGAAPTMVQLLHMNAVQNDLANEQMTHLIELSTIQAEVAVRDSMQKNQEVELEKERVKAANQVKQQFDTYFKVPH